MGIGGKDGVMPPPEPVPGAATRVLSLGSPEQPRPTQGHPASEGSDQSRTLEPDCLSPRLQEGVALAFVCQSKSSHFWAPPGCQLGAVGGWRGTPWGSHRTQRQAQSGDVGNIGWEDTSQQALSMYLLCACLRGNPVLLLGWRAWTRD